MDDKDKISHSPENDSPTLANSDKSLTLKEYLETAADASRRTRFITIIMVVVSVLVGVSVLNSADRGWITLRLNALQKRTESPYTARKFPLLCRCDVRIGDQSSDACKELEEKQKEVKEALKKFDQIDEKIKDLNNKRINLEDEISRINTNPGAQADGQIKAKTKTREEINQELKEWQNKRDAVCNGENYRWETFFQAMTKTSAENKFTVHVPFFGIAFDVNDIGVLGGFSLLIVLILLRLSLRSQIVSLRIGFKQAFARDQEKYFYEILAAQQVFVFPPLRHDQQKVSVSQGWIEQWWRRSIVGKFYQRVRLRLLQLFDTLRGSVLPLLQIEGTSKSTADDQADAWQANRNMALRVVPKGVSLLPFIVYAVQFKFDLDTTHYGFELSSFRTNLLIIFGAFFLVNIFVFGVWCITKWNELDRLWDYYDDHIQKRRKLGDS